MKQSLIRNTTKAHWGLPIWTPKYRPCTVCGWPVIFDRCEKCQPVTEDEIRLAEEADAAAEMALDELEAAETI